MTAKELAAKLNGRTYGEELSREEERQAQNDGLVVIYGYSDDNVVIQGAIDDDVGAFDGTEFYLTKDGIFEELECGRTNCPFLEIAKRSAKKFVAVWHDEGNPCWTFETKVPHETFGIYGEGELFGIGIVISMEDLA